MLSKWYMLSFFWQITFFSISAAIVNYALGEKSGMSTFLGGLTYCVPTLLANIYMHSGRDTGNEFSVVGRAFISNVYKLVMTAGVLVFIFKKVDISAGVFVVFYCIGSVVQFVTSFFSINRE
jgi:F0F1-type ATP synthase assembly protein I